MPTEKAIEVGFVAADIQDLTTGLRYYERHPSLLALSAVFSVEEARNVLIAAYEAGVDIFIFTSSGSIQLTKKGKNVDKGHRHSASLHGQRHKSARELADTGLRRAIELSLQEVHGSKSRPGYVPSQPSPSRWGYSDPPIVDRSRCPSDRKTAVADDEDDPDLKAAIEASLREANAPKPSAPIVVGRGILLHVLRAHPPSATSSQQQQANLARLASYAPSQRQQYQAQAPPPPQQHQQPTVQAPPAPVVLPQFPSAPTAAPQPMYSTYAPSGFEQEERDQALLIDS
ncbi:hypothetical protein NLJ89_g8925 [Agrocybe chaxingu]|uniref:Uncharacterized protein n=1 Tax=Agrocybe chaxingu TaxID=84603 RepID=A0A9W8JWP6_9AGAR|nr:hypothetical protein NLJ89_g8925 [Agrocybe chaxingu]